MPTKTIETLIDFTEAGQFWDDHNMTPDPDVYYKPYKPYCHACLIGILAVHHNIIDPATHDRYTISYNMMIKGLEEAGYSNPYLQGLDHGFTYRHPIEQRFKQWDAEQVWQYVKGVYHGITVRQTAL